MWRRQRGGGDSGDLAYSSAGRRGGDGCCKRRKVSS